MTAPITPAAGSPQEQAMHDLAAVLAAPDAIERLGFEVYDRIRRVSGCCLGRATRLIRFAGENTAVQLDEGQRERAVAAVIRAGSASLTAVDIDHCLRSAAVREVLRTKSNRKGAAA